MGSHKAILGAAVIALAAVTLSCWPRSNDCDGFFRLPSLQREAEFENYPVERQLDIYLCGMNMEPPHMGLAIYIANGGEKNVPFLLQKLKSEKRENVEKNIIFVFGLMAIKGRLKGRHDVLDQIEPIVAGMKFRVYKEPATEDLDLIRKSL
jgi:hypothetical protein